MNTKRISAALILLICTVFLWAGSLEKSINNNRVSLQYHPMSDNIFNAAMESDTQILKHFHINLPRTGSYNIHVSYNGMPKTVETSLNEQPLYQSEEIYIGLQRVLHITLNPFVRQGGSVLLYDEYSIDVDFENQLIKKDGFAVNSNAVNAEYTSPLSIQSFKDISVTSYLKIETQETGIYRIDAEDIENAGLIPSMIDPYKLCMFTPDSMMIRSDTPDMFVYRNPVKIPFAFKGDNDNIFEKGEYILFYGESVNGDDKNIYQGYDLYNNPYTVNNTFMLVLNSSESPLRAYDPELTFEDYDNRINNTLIMHYDSICPLAAGYGWAWKKFDMGPDSTDMNYSIIFNTEDAVSDTAEIEIKIFFETDDTFAIDFILNDDTVYSFGTGMHNLRIPQTIVFPVFNLQTTNRMEILLRKIDGYYKRMYLDEMRVMYLSDIGLENEISVKNLNYRGLSINTSGDKFVYLKNSNEFIGELETGTFNILMNNPSKLFISEDLKIPSSIEFVDNKSTYSFVGAEIIIITGNGMRNAVNAYKQYREEQGYSVKVFEIDDIYNAFTLGRQSPVAIKSLMYFAFANWNIKPEYLILLGAGTYDYREILNPSVKRNIVPVYEDGYGIFVEGLIPSYISSMTDRWFCTVVGDDDFIDVIPGRITALNEREAKDALRKIMDYEKRMNVDAQNRVLIIADDEYSSRTSSSFTENWFTRNAEYLANVIEGDYHVEKIYLMDYIGDKQTYDEHWPYDPGEKRDVRYDIDAVLNKGVGVCYFYGHGANYTLTHEHILLYPDDIGVLTNLYNYPIWVLGTCSAAQFDYDNGSIGDVFQKLPYSGFSATLAATRATSDGNNVDLIKNIFSEDLKAGTFSTLGEYYNSIVNTNGKTNTQFVIIGDPVMDMRKRVHDISATEYDTFDYGTLDTIHLYFADNSLKDVSVCVYQPEYLDSHDYKHSEPYIYQYYDKSDGIIFKGQYSVSGNELSIAVPFPDTLSDKNYYDIFEITAIYSEDNIIHYCYNRSNVLLNLNNNDDYNIDPSIRVRSEGIEIDSSIHLPSSYRIEISVNDLYGVYQGNLAQYQSVITVNGKVERLSEFIYDNKKNIYKTYFDIDSDQLTDTVGITVFNNKLLSSNKLFTVEHMSGVKYFRNLTLYPNPSDEFTNISFLSNGGGILTYSIINSRGGIADKSSFPFNDGFNTFKINTEKGFAGYIAPGVYIIKMAFNYFGRKDIIYQDKKLIKVVR